MEKHPDESRKIPGVDDDRMPGTTEPEDPEMRLDVDEFIGGPGVIGTRSMYIGGLEGAALTTVIGVLVGWIIGIFLSGGGELMLASIVGFGAAGAVAGFVAGGFLRPRLKDEPAEDANFNRLRAGRGNV